MIVIILEQAYYTNCMLDTNCENKQATKSQQLLRQFVKEIGTVVFSTLGLICCCILLFYLQTSSYTKVFSSTTITACDSSASRYLTKCQAIEILATVLDCVCIALFAILMLLAMLAIFCNIRATGGTTKGPFCCRTTCIYLLILASGSLFGNCVKTSTNIKQVYSCSSSQETLNNFYNNSQNLSLVAGISFCAAVILLFVNPILWRQKPKPNKSPRLAKQIELFADQNTHSLHHLAIPDKKTEPIDGNSDRLSAPDLPSKPHTEKHPRIFGRKFLTQSRYGLSPPKQKMTASRKIYDIDSNLVQSATKKSKLKASPRAIDLEIQSKIQLNIKSEDSKEMSAKQEPHAIESHLIRVSGGPPLQLGQYTMLK